ncbi:hypothetical protein EV359DRAFT_68288 [Lentinula novae-zelandiae]|nr:hypothetical protein EV359DRAFT_68288 [Lentinula novae-zelandiae]
MYNCAKNENVKRAGSCVKFYKLQQFWISYWGTIVCPPSTVFSFLSILMFSRTTASRFFTLFCLWVNVLSIAASPVSYKSEGSPPTQFGPPLPPPRRIQNLQILTTRFGEAGEHSSLLIGTTCVHALTEDGIVHLDSILTPKKTPNQYTAARIEGLVGSKQTSLGKASFRDQAEEQEAIDKILEIKLPRFDQGGNCRDFIRLALGVLIRKKNAVWEEVMPKFEKFYEERTPVLEKHLAEAQKTSKTGAL